MGALSFRGNEEPLDLYSWNNNKLDIQEISPCGRDHKKSEDPKFEIMGALSFQGNEEPLDLCS